MNKLFEYLEDVILASIAIMTLGAVGFELASIYERGVIELADLLLMFIYAEVFGIIHWHNCSCSINRSPR